MILQCIYCAYARIDALTFIWLFVRIVADSMRNDAIQEMKRGQVTMRLLTVREVAKILRVNDTTVRRWVEQGVLQAVRLPGQGDKRRGYRIDEEKLLEIIDPVTK